MTGSEAQISGKTKTPKPVSDKAQQTRKSISPGGKGVTRGRI